jgi:hypothetical protein
MLQESPNRLLVIDDQQELCEFIAEVAKRLGFDAPGVPKWIVSGVLSDFSPL